MSLTSNIPLEDDGHDNSDVDNDLFPPPAPENQHAKLLLPPPRGDAPDAPEDSDDDDDPLGLKEVLSRQNGEILTCQVL